MSGRSKAEARYNAWWAGKMCRLAFQRVPFRKVRMVRAIGNPSFVYGVAEIIYENGDREMIHTQAFKPRLCDVEVMP
jgi:hypothetical protein